MPFLKQLKMAEALHGGEVIERLPRGLASFVGSVSPSDRSDPYHVSFFNAAQPTSSLLSCDWVLPILTCCSKIFIYDGSTLCSLAVETHCNLGEGRGRTLATNSERVLSALWGKLAAEILMQNWDSALDDLTKLKDIIDSNTFAPFLEQLQQRTWVMHWSLFVFFNHENGRNAIIDLFFQERCG